MEIDLQNLQQRANQIRKDIINMVASAQSGHPGGALGLADVFAALYFHVLRHDPHRPNWDKRDRLLLSNGHTCAVLYAALAESGYFPKQELLSFRQLGSRLQGHPHLGSTPGIEMTSGPLGLGVSQAAGLATAFKMDGKNNRVYVVASDGEQQEGQTWEAYYFAGASRLGNLTIIIDRNNIQISGHVEQILPLEPFAEKLRSFRWKVLEVDGHNIPKFITACEVAQQSVSQPTAIICNTIPGKGVDFMENNPDWHGKAPNQELTQRALLQLEKNKS